MLKHSLRCLLPLILAVSFAACGDKSSRNSGASKLLLATRSGSSSVWVSQLRQAGEEPHGLATTEVGADPRCLVASPVLNMFFVCNRAGALLQSFAVDASTGVLSRLQARGVGSQPEAVVVSSSGTRIYVVSGGTSAVEAYEVSATDGALTAIGTFAVGTSPKGAVLSPLGGHLYVANFADGSISVLLVNSSTGALSPVETVSSGAGTAALAIDEQGHFLYAANRQANTITSFRVDTSTGKLSLASSVATGSEPTALLVDGNSKRGFVANRAAGTVSSFQITDGAWSVLDTKPAGATPESLVLDSARQYLFAAASGSDEILRFKVDSTGALSVLGQVAQGAGSAPVGLAMVTLAPLLR